MKYIVFMCRTLKILISNWPRMRKFSQVLQAGKTVAFDSSHHGQALVMLYVQSLCSDWSKFDRWVNAENLCSFLKLVYFDSWSWHSFFLCDVFNCLFLLDLRNVACQSRKSDFGWHRFVFVFHLAWLKSLKRFWPYLIASRSCISNGKPE